MTATIVDTDLFGEEGGVVGYGVLFGGGVNQITYRVSKKSKVKKNKNLGP